MGNKFISILRFGALLAIVLVASQGVFDRPWRLSVVSSAFAGPASDLRGLPIAFEPNRGQADGHVRFLAHSRVSTIFLTEAGATVAFHGRAGSSAAAIDGTMVPTRGIAALLNQSVTHPTVTTAASFRLQYMGATPSHIVGVGKLPGRVNYFIGRDPRTWHTNIPTYARVAYRNVYPGVDLAWYGTQRRLEYDWIVRPGADPSLIRLRIGGGGKPVLDSGGDLVVRAGTASIVQKRPVIYQMGPERHRVPVNGGFSVTGDGTVRFQLGRYDHGRQLVIDPGVVTFLGGGDLDALSGLVTGRDGSPWVTGESDSINYPLQNPIQVSKRGQASDMVVTKLSPNLNAILVSTYVGGMTSGVAGAPATSGGNDIAIDANGQPVIVGSTNATDFPTVRASQGTSGGGIDAVMLRLNPSGDHLDFSTFVGGPGTDMAVKVRIDAQGSSIAGMWTNSASGLPKTAGAAQSAYPGSGTCTYPGSTAGHPCFSSYLITFDAAGGIQSATYLGASADTFLTDISVDGAGNAFLIGSVRGPGLPVSSDALQSTFGGVGRNGFLARLRGAQVTYASYFGGSRDLDGSALAIGPDGTVITAFSEAYPADTGTSMRAGVVRWMPAGSGYSLTDSLTAAPFLQTSFGYDSSIQALSIVSSPTGAVIVMSGDGQSSVAGHRAAFVGLLRGLDTGLVMLGSPATVVGDTDAFAAPGLAAIASETAVRVYAAGDTTSTVIRADGPTTTGVNISHLQVGSQQGGGAGDGWIAVFDMNVQPPVASATETPTLTPIVTSTVVATSTPTPTVTQKPTAKPTARPAKKCKTNQRRVRGKCQCKPGYTLAHGKCRKKKK